MQAWCDQHLEGGSSEGAHDLRTRRGGGGRGTCVGACMHSSRRQWLVAPWKRFVAHAVLGAASCSMQGPALKPQGIPHAACLGADWQAGASVTGRMQNLGHDVHEAGEPSQVSAQGGCQ